MTNQENQRYEVLDRLDAGGMAEVFRGKAISLGGLEKAIAIKRVLPSLVGNDKFVKMFIDEARLSLRLSHANIVSVFDIARSGPTYFIVMEFIDGTNLKKVLEKGVPIPVGMAVLITVDVCKGLAYAHERADNEGRPLNVVHRDVSPPNILISRKGEVKLTDFGLAKAKSQLETTDPGVVKGKFSYLSPEAARGEDVDHRADIFAAGIVLWEMLGARRLFLGETDMDTLKLVREAEIPPLRALNSEVPPELEEIVRRSLARDPDHRYQSAREFAKDLARFTVRSGQAASSFDLEVFIEDFLKSQARNAPGNAVRDELTRAVIQEEMNKLIRIDGAEQAEEPSAVRGSALVDTRMWDFDDDDDDDEGPLATAPMGRMAANLGTADAGAGMSTSAPSTPAPRPVSRGGGPGLPPPPSRSLSPPSPSRPPPASPAAASPPPASPPAPSPPPSSPPAPAAAVGGVGSPRTRSAYATRGGGNVDVLDRAPEEIRVGKASPRVASSRPSRGGGEDALAPTAPAAEARPAADEAPALEGESGSGKSGQLVFYGLVAAIVVMVLYLVWSVAT